MTRRHILTMARRALLLLSPLGILGCDATPLEYQSCYPKSQAPPPVGPLYECFIDWCASDCDDPEKAKRERREEKLLAPDGDTAEKCWEEKTGSSDQYVDLDRGCTYAETYSTGDQG